MWVDQEETDTAAWVEWQATEATNQLEYVARDAIPHPSLIACARVVCRSVRKENRDVCVHCLLCEMDLDNLNQV